MSGRARLLGGEGLLAARTRGLYAGRGRLENAGGGGLPRRCVQQRAPGGGLRAALISPKPRQARRRRGWRRFVFRAAGGAGLGALERAHAGVGLGAARRTQVAENRSGFRGQPG